MNLMKLFNKNYLIQNLKKSKVVISIFTCLIPILNTIILIMMLTNNKNYILSFAEISIINFIGIYILPIIISICLFNYVYKKKSVDFINSMPISRKSIFVTNTVLGIMIFLLMLVINIILILVVTSIFNTIVPFKMLLDYFWFFALVYIFAFATTNLAMSISGNAITQVIVTLLLFFLIPYISVYVDALYYENTTNNVYLDCTQDECMPKTYYCYDDIECNMNKELNKYKISLEEEKEKNYTAMFGLMYDGLLGNDKLINKIAILKMIFLSVIYVVVGYIFFVNRKMEVSETTFKNIHVHNFVKSLTIIPMVSIIYYCYRKEVLIFVIFLITLLLIYYLVYDLITKKSITHIKMSLLYFCSTFLILFAIFSLIDKNNIENNVIKYSDIKEIAIDINGRDNIDKILYINNKELISLIIKELLSEVDYDLEVDYVTVNLKLNNNKEYKTSFVLSNDVYDRIINILSKEDKYVKYYKDINFDDVYAVKIGSNIYSKKEALEYLELIENSIDELSLKEFLDLEKKYNNLGEETKIVLYRYKTNRKEEFTISGYINYDLLNIIINSNNKMLVDNIPTTIPNYYYVYYVNSYMKEKNNIDNFLLRSAKNEIYNFILNNLNNKVDMRKEFITLDLDIDGDIYQFTTNNIEDFIKILNQKYNEIKDTDEYKEYIEQLDKESVEYYD